ncbi:pilus assembly FimT family protein [Desulfobacula phenolica]|uniref:Prepilin-type N-terminal cleavage/methylation domain-containing protein n=1 Tax=Desulfobacula phenolica TaxID=90732 RepID=A0A1H2J027_9BACT|nr:prepilin-type N-terminal cleavage/methylation domain-containing protein [Desulfobacula phenolica]SDU49817.1 prepilin-type N-terminal cleavage/methylation domain-containing protein [Desulfobacula phenolica]
MKFKQNSQTGFTLIEVMVVVFIVGLILAMVLPRAMRASVDTKYQLVRQGATEIAAWANEWARREITLQPETAVSTLNDYMQTLGDSGSVDWIAASDNTSNWQGTPEKIPTRGSAPNDVPSTTVKDIMPQDKVIKNPFNGLYMFSGNNLPSGTNIFPGALGCAYVADGVYNYYALIFQGTDATSVTDFYANMGTSLEGLRSGVYINRLRP